MWEDGLDDGGDYAGGLEKTRRGRKERCPTTNARHDTRPLSENTVLTLVLPLTASSIMNADEQAAENRRRRTFRKFTYRGVEVRPPPIALVAPSLES